MATVWQGTPAELLDDLGHAIAEQYRTIADALEVQLRRALEQAIVSPPDLVARLRVARDLERQARELVATMPPDKIAAAVTSIVSGEASAEIARQLLQIPSLAGTTVTAGGLLAVAAIEIELRDSLRALNARILRAPADAYQRMTAATVPAMLAGRSTWQQVQRRQVDGYLAEGISGFTDNSGRRWRIGSYAEMATRTAAARAWRDQSVASMAGAGIETFTPVIGADACAACGAWAGKVLTNGGQTGRVMVPHAITAEPTELVIDATIDAARSAGWGHPNCRCVLVAALPGLSRKQLTTHDPEREAARDKMRALERDVRDAKRDGSPADVKSAQSALRAHSKQHGIARRSFREQLGFSDGLGGGGTSTPRATAPKAPPKPKKWTDDLPKLQRPESLTDATYRANPGAVRDARGQYPDGFSYNCSHVANAMEMRARGFDVRASEVAGRHGRTFISSVTDWTDPNTGGLPSWSNAPTKTRNLRKWLDEATGGFPDGARGLIDGEWKTGGGHVFNWQKSGGVTQIFEGQRPVDTDSYFANLRPSKSKLLRVDDLVPDQTVRSSVIPDNGTPPVVSNATQRAHTEARIAATRDKLARLLDKGSPYKFDDVGITLRAVSLLQYELADLTKYLSKIGR